MKESNKTVTKKIHPELEAKLQEQKKLYEKVTAFAELLPLFSKKIIENELTVNKYSKLADNFGKLYCPWGINWHITTPINYPEEKHSQVGFVNVYINCMSLFSQECYPFAHAELAKVLPEIKVHFYDNWNSTFYFLADEAEEGLKKLEQWYLNTMANCNTYLKGKRKEQLEKELKELEKNDN